MRHEKQNASNNRIMLSLVKAKFCDDLYRRIIIFLLLKLPMCSEISASKYVCNVKAFLKSSRKIGGASVGKRSSSIYRGSSSGGKKSREMSLKLKSAAASSKSYKRAGAIEKDFSTRELRAEQAAMENKARKIILSAIASSCQKK